MYTMYQDEFGKPIIGGVKNIRRVNVNVSAGLTNFSVSLPEGDFYGVQVLRIPDGISFEIGINKSDLLPVDEGMAFGPFVKDIDEIFATTTGTSTDPVVLALYE